MSPAHGPNIDVPLGRVVGLPAKRDTSPTGRSMVVSVTMVSKVVMLTLWACPTPDEPFTRAGGPPTAALPRNFGARFEVAVCVDTSGW